MNTRTVALAGLLAAIAVVAVLAFRPSAGPAVATAASGQDELTPFLRFSGTGTVNARPDTAAVTVTTLGAAPTSKAALAESSRSMDAVIARLTALTDPAIAADDIQSQGVSSYQEGREDARRWRASNTIQVTVHDPAKAGAVLTAANAAGADQVSGPSFTLEDRRAAEAEALRKAIQDARSEADAAAAEMGARVDRVVSVVELDASAPVAVRTAAFDAAKVPTPIDAPAPTPQGTLDVEVRVVVTFAYSR